MKKIILLCIPAFLGVVNASAQQIDFGIKAGAVYNTDSGTIKDLQTTYERKGEGNVGYQIGALLRAKTGGIYIQPELLYTKFSNEYTISTGVFTEEKTRVDIPVNVGVQLLGLAHVQAGPVFSYYMENKNSLDFINAKQDKYNLGLQIGAGVEIADFLIDARYEFSVSKMNSTFQNSVNFYNYNTENRPSLLNISVTYLF